MTESYEVRMTPLAAAVAGTRYSVADVERAARGELVRLGVRKPSGLIFHCFALDPARDAEFICRPTRDGAALLVDTVSFDEVDEPLASGPFAGKKVMMPSGDSEE